LTFPYCFRLPCRRAIKTANPSNTPRTMDSGWNPGILGFVLATVTPVRLPIVVLSIGRAIV